MKKTKWMWISIVFMVIIVVLLVVIDVNARIDEVNIFGTYFTADQEVYPDPGHYIIIKEDGVAEMYVQLGTLETGSYTVLEKLETVAILKVQMGESEPAIVIIEDKSLKIYNAQNVSRNYAKIRDIPLYLNIKP